MPDMDTAERWYIAERRADPVHLPNLRTGRRGGMIVAVVLAIAAIVIGYGLLFWPLIGPLVAGGASTKVPNTLQPLLGLGLQRSAVLLGLIAVLVGAFTTHIHSHWQPITGALNRDERSSIRLQMTGEDLLDYRRLPLLVVIAKQQHQYIRSVTPIYVAVVLYTVSWALLSDAVEVHYVSVGITAVLLAIGAWLLVVFRRVDAFIATNPHRPYERTPEWNSLEDELAERELNPGGVTE
jgi:hypothetical protein